MESILDWITEALEKLIVGELTLEDTLSQDCFINAWSSDSLPSLCNGCSKCSICFLFISYWTLKCLNDYGRKNSNNMAMNQKKQWRRKPHFLNNNPSYLDSPRYVLSIITETDMILIAATVPHTLTMSLAQAKCFLHIPSPTFCIKLTHPTIWLPAQMWSDTTTNTCSYDKEHEDGSAEPHRSHTGKNC